MAAKRFLFLLPLAVFGVLAAYFAVGLTKDPSRIPSVLIDQPVPEFRLEPIEGRPNPGREWGLTSDDLKGRVSLVNIWGSWCVACRVEHPFLMRLQAMDVVPLHGIDWREKDPKAGPDWLAKWGDPYDLIGADPDSKAAIAFGVTGAPETFVVDADGVIRYKHIGPMNEEVWDTTIRPIIAQLRGAP